LGLDYYVSKFAQLESLYRAVRKEFHKKETRPQPS